MNKAQEILNLIDETRGLDLEKIIGPQDNGLFYIKFNGNVYGYKPKGLGMEDLVRKFKKMVGFSVGRALAWLKKNTEHIEGGTKKPISIRV